MKLVLLTSLSTVAAFAPITHKATHPTTLNADATTLSIPTKPIFDPLGFYPENSLERQSNLIQPLEETLPPNREIIDPLRLYSDKSQVSTVEMSPSLPFLPRPSLLKGLPGDRGFDPFNLSPDIDSLQWQRRAEIKHSRLAMLASLGWIMAELFHKQLAESWSMPYMLASGDRVPSVLNDGLVHAPYPLFWIAAVAAAAGMELCEVIEENYGCKLYPGDWNFDPLNLGGKDENQQFFMREAEVLNGRLGMLGITGFALHEWLWNSAVVNQITPFFKPLQLALEQVSMSG
jgi:hypothetical protein